MDYFLAFFFGNLPWLSSSSIAASSALMAAFCSSVNSPVGMIVSDLPQPETNPAATKLKTNNCERTGAYLKTKMFKRIKREARTKPRSTLRNLMRRSKTAYSIASVGTPSSITQARIQTSESTVKAVNRTEPSPNAEFRPLA